MLILLRIIFGLALAYAVKLAHANAQGAGAAGLFDSLFYVGLVFFLALANAAVWAPYFGSQVANALAGDGSLPPGEVKPRKTGFARVLSVGLKVGAFAVVIGLGFWVWQYRSMFDPLQDLVRAWRMGHAPWSAPERELTVLRVIDGENLQARNAEGHIFNIRLAGLEAPSGGSYDPAVRERSREGREFLGGLLLSNTVQVEVTLTNAARVILGFVRVGDTNVNAVCVARGYADFAPDALGSASLRSRWSLLQADRRAQATRGAGAPSS